MARIPESELQHLKAAVSLVEVVRGQGRKVVKRGKGWVVLCPFHQENTPSCVISPDKNLYHCFGCDAGGSVLDWVMKTEGLSLPHAVDKLRREAGEMPATAALPPVADIANEQERQALLHRVTEFYHHTLLNAPEAVAYLEKRRLHHPELVAQFRLGFANRTLGYRLPSKKLKDGAAIRAQLQAIGVMRDSGHEHLAGSLVVPVIDINGQVRELYGRKLCDKLRAGTPKHLYLPGPHGGVWNEQALVASRSVILCESLVDAMSFWVAGYRNVTAAYGVNGFTDEMRQAFIRHGVKQVLIAFDNDTAGDDGAVKLASALAADGIAPFRVVFPSGMDANGYLCQVAEPEAAFGLLVDGALPMGEVVSAKPENDAVPQPEKPSQPAASLAAGVVVEALPNGEVEIALSGQQWRIRGMASVKVGSGVMKVNAQVLDTESGVVFADSVDMMSARSRAGYARLAASELGLAESDLRRCLGRVLLALENHLAQPETDDNTALELDDAAKAEALALLCDPNLIGRLTDDLAACGVVGESTNLVAGYLAAVSRKLDRPLAVLIQSSSAAGKSSLMDAVLNLIPPEERLQYSAMTGQSLFYLGETNLQHKILAIAEEEGVRQAAYALKLLQSDGELTIASTGKDDATGNLVTKQYTVKGPVMLMLTTTAIDVDEELLNRCLVLTVNESREQTEAIHALQRHKQTLEGLLMENEKGYLTELHQNAQRLLRTLKVVNPYASQLTFLSDKTRTRRDHMKYLTLIQSVALLHQYQREVKTVEHRGQVIEYIEVERSDIVLANKLAHEILGRTLDEMPPQTRKLLLLIQGMVNQLAHTQNKKPGEVRFTRRDIRDATQWSDNQLKVHCLRLVEMEYLLVHGGSRGHLLQYELLWDGRGNGDNTHLCGLIDPPEATPAGHYDSRKLEVKGIKLASSCPQVGAKLESGKSRQATSGKGSLAASGDKAKSPVPAKRNKRITS
ncbi:DnaG primase-like protein [Pectobacterium atrosepticum SCRI1043]|uniref:DnaG primase-like protein n=1 Tax=Pectobacterium atrosepticum (strain SCRI 1043 / ATCC BAA-672) TaxID=218491 RepID=Q6D1P5_PECAS|nr:DNA primase [Pectobacterium atrosepticum]MCA6980775.1 CHC2 zinc finger domain-containing protein [Pectobacterium atrosepticum]MCH5021947.1 toprim domain-containing protein [Pectobacterium atrosepticum]MCL6319062.1 toprim domain-containing protein [Pectobacterium atrosepticum]MCL6323472.1 toprim domain-containing protein [Pectobacterium atrosepticum]QWC50167.1 toprim domain-containing protein [Pectobacterium atrosepticum]